jgi:HAD superfamily hydrolase (TIGR01509 family)
LIHALLFDVDGTLADTEEAHRLAFEAAFRDLELPFTWSPAEYKELLGVPGGKERLAHYFAGLALPAEERRRLTGLVAALHAQKTERFAELVAAGGAPLRPGIARLLAEAEAAGVRLAIASTTTAENVVALLQAGLGPRAAERFPVIACGDMVRAKKPAPDVYLLALAQLGVAARDAVAFEDSELGLAAAKSAGLFTVVTPTRWTEEQDLRAADLLVPHLGDPTAPLEGDDAARAGGPWVTVEGLLGALGRPRRDDPSTERSAAWRPSTRRP